MKKLESAAAALALIVIAPVMAVIWFWETFGIWGVILAGAAMGAAIWIKVAGDRQSAAEQDRVFDLSVGHALTAKDNPDERRAELRRWQHMNALRSEALRCVQIMADGLYHATMSAKPATAESRMESARQQMATLCSVYAAVLTPQSFEMIRQTMGRAEILYSTVRYLMPAMGHLDKAKVLKTRTAKLKYLTLAKEHLIAGQADPESDKESIGTMLGQVERTISECG